MTESRIDLSFTAHDNLFLCFSKQDRSCLMRKIKT